MVKLTKFSLSVVAAFWASQLAADEAVNSVNLDTVQVTSSVSNSEIDSYKVSVRNASLIRDILRDVPGVYISGTNGLNQKVYMRGINDRGVNLTIDGARQKGNAFHHAADLYIDADIIKAVDIGLGVHSVVGTSGALGGTMAFKTADASDLLEFDQNFGGKIKAGFASNNEEWQQSLTLAGQYEGLEALAYVGHRGYKQGEAGNHVQTSTDKSGSKIGGEGDDLNYLFKFGMNFTDYAKLTLSAEHMEIKGDYGMRAEWPSLGELVDTKYYRNTYTANFTLNPNDYVDLTWNAYTTNHRATSTVDAGVKTAGTKLINKTKVGDEGGFNQTFVYGAEFYRSASYNKKASHVPDDVAKSFSVFLEDQIRYGGFTFTPGIRFDHYTLDTMGGASGAAGRAHYSWNEWSPAVLADYQFDFGLGFYASYAKVFRGPDPIEAIRLSDDNVLFTTTNGELDPETGDAYEIGARYQTQISDNQSLSLTGAFFYNDYDNLIVEMASAGVIDVQRQNGGRATVKGVEAAVRYAVGNLSLQASYSRARTSYKDKDANAGYGGVLAYSDAGDKYTFNAEYVFAGIDTLIGYNLIAYDRIKAKNGSGSEFTKPGYAVSDIYATWAPSSERLEGLEVNVGVYNIFDKAYWSHSQRSAGGVTCRRGQCSPGSIDWEPGRNIKASVSYKF